MICECVGVFVCVRVCTGVCACVRVCAYVLCVCVYTHGGCVYVCVCVNVYACVVILCIYVRVCVHEGSTVTAHVPYVSLIRPICVPHVGLLSRYRV